jgi:hypothetical protein
MNHTSSRNASLRNLSLIVLSSSASLNSLFLIGMLLVAYPHLIEMSKTNFRILQRLRLYVHSNVSSLRRHRESWFSEAGPFLQRSQFPTWLVELTHFALSVPSTSPDTQLAGGYSVILVAVWRFSGYPTILSDLYDIVSAKLRRLAFLSITDSSLGQHAQQDDLREEEEVDSVPVSST